MMALCLKMKRTDKDETGTQFIRNGSLLLEALIAFCNGKSNPIRTFSAKELIRATKNYGVECKVLSETFYSLYKGSLQDRLISVKNFLPSGGFDISSIITDIVIGSQMSVHKNVLKLIGCCLQTLEPIAVYEYVGHKTLSDCIHGTNEVQPQPLSWRCRLRMTMEIANAVAYLHTGFSRPIIHCDIKLKSILIDQDYVPKLYDFSLSVSIPDGESYVQCGVRGTQGYVAPEFFRSAGVTEKADVYSFGVLLLQILAGRKTVCLDRSDEEVILLDFVHSCVEKNRVIESVDPAVVNEEIKEEQLLAFATLALSCVQEEAEERPTMTDVARQLKKIYQTA